MIKNTNVIEVVKEDRIYSLLLPIQASLGELHDVLFQMRSFVIDRINEAIKADEPKAPEEYQQAPETPKKE
jgi:hypothetical protein